jgi:peptidyl-prolyl cis-trans isomerase C
MKRTLMAIVALVGAALPLAAQVATPSPAPAVADPSQKPVASINGETITLAQLDALYSHIPGPTRDQYEQHGGKMAFLDNYLRKRLLIQEAVKQGFDKQPDVIAELNQARDAALFDRYVRDVVASEVISDALVRKFYDDHLDGFKFPATAKVRHILATDTPGSVSNTSGSKARTKEEAARKILDVRAELFAKQKALHGDTPEQRQALINAFAQAADKYSEDATAGQGGDLGWVGPGKMDPTFEEAAFNLEPGQISGMIQTKFGYHLILVEERRPEGTASFDEVKGRIREEMLKASATEVVEALTRLTNELRAQSKVSLHPENVK